MKSLWPTSTTTLWRYGQPSAPVPSCCRGLWTESCQISSQVFTPEGELLLKFGSNGEGNGQFNAPTGVAVDVNGNIIVADWGNSRIQVQWWCACTSSNCSQLMSCLFNIFSVHCAFMCRSLTAVVLSCPTSTHQPTLSMGRRVLLWPQTDMWWWQIRATTVSKSTVTFNDGGEVKRREWRGWPEGGPVHGSGFLHEIILLTPTIEGRKGQQGEISSQDLKWNQNKRQELSKRQSVTDRLWRLEPRINAGET